MSTRVTEKWSDEIGARLKEARKEAGMNQVDVADILNKFTRDDRRPRSFDRTSISHLECGRRTINRRLRIELCGKLGLELAELGVINEVSA